jgi:hypothetical protein
MGFGKMITQGPIGDFLKAQKNPSQENFDKVLKIIPGAETLKQTSPAAQAVQNNYVSRRRAQKLQSNSSLNATTTLLGG